MSDHTIINYYYLEMNSALETAFCTFGTVYTALVLIQGICQKVDFYPISYFPVVLTILRKCFSLAAYDEYYRSRL